MSESDSTHFLWNTETDWALLHLAHASVPDVARQAWLRLLTHYEQPVWRALCRLVRDESVAQDLYQEFWHRFLRGDFAHATPERGRFRNLLQTALIHLVADHYRQPQHMTDTLIEDVSQPDNSLLNRLAADPVSY